MTRWTPENIRKLRRDYGETQEQFAKRMDVAKITICVWEQGKGEPIGPARLLLSRLEEDLLEGKIREVQPA